MVKNKSKLAIKLFIIVWIVLAVHIALKLTFNYWQPYIIPNEQLQAVSDFIDSHSIIKIGLNGVLYFINALIMILCSIKCWWFKSKKQTIIVMILIVIGFVYNLITGDAIINTLILAVILPLFLDKTKWLYMLLTFALNNVFLLLSLWLEQFASVDDMNYIIRILFQMDYYIMLVLNYFVFNLITFKKVK